MPERPCGCFAPLTPAPFTSDPFISFDPFRQRDKINVPRTHYFLGEVSSARFEGAGVLAIGLDSGRLPTLQS